MSDNDNMIDYTPADKWLNILNKKYPNIWAMMKKARETMGLDAQKVNKEYMREIPNSIEMPYLLAPFMFYYLSKYKGYHDTAYKKAVAIRREKGETSKEFIKEMNRVECEICSLASMYLWRKSKGVYRFSSEMYEELINQPLDCNLQMESFFRLPEWAVYIETPGLKVEEDNISGFIANIDYHIDYQHPDDRSPCLFILYFTDNKNTPYGMILPFMNNTLKEVVDKVSEINEKEIIAEKEAGLYDGTRESVDPDVLARFLTQVLNLLMYLCSEEPDITPRTEPVSHSHHKAKGLIPKEHKVWDVGVRISRFIKEYKHTYSDNDEDTPETGRTVRPHIRRAHWHTYWIGPRDAVYPERQAIPKWLPPIPVNVKWQEELPVNIKIVDEESEE